MLKVERRAANGARVSDCQTIKVYFCFCVQVKLCQFRKCAVAVAWVDFVKGA